MLTPAFEISQTDSFITIIIHARFAKVAETEVFIQEEEFKFYSKPYFLRLNFPGNLTEDGRESAKYDVESGVFTLRVPKATQGEHFPGLDMITKLLAPKGATDAKSPLIEVIASTKDAEADCGNLNEEEDFDEDFDWQIEQVPYCEDTAATEGYKYGFGCLRSGVFSRLQDELQDVVDVHKPDWTPPHERTRMRLQDEQDKFDAEYYLADLYEDDAVEEVLSFKPGWIDEYKRLKNDENPEKFVYFSKDDLHKMSEFPNKEYLLDRNEEASALLGLIDIIYAYAYDQRTTEGEGNVESAWTIRKLSSSLSWLENFTSLKCTVCSCLRRAVCYPLYRHWKLCKKVLRDTIMIFSLGKRRLLKCLLEIHTSLNHSDPYYILNDLYVSDYCVWLQGVSEKRLSSLTRSLTKLKIEKDDIGLDLVHLERAAELAQENQNAEDEISTGLSSITLDQNPSAGLRFSKVNDTQEEKSSNPESDLSEKLGELFVNEVHPDSHGFLKLDTLGIESVGAETSSRNGVEKDTDSCAMNSKRSGLGEDKEDDKADCVIIENLTETEKVTCLVESICDNEPVKSKFTSVSHENGMSHLDNSVKLVKPDVKDSDDDSSESESETSSDSGSSSYESCSDSDSEESSSSDCSEKEIKNTVSLDENGKKIDGNHEDVMMKTKLVTLIDSD